MNELLEQVAYYVDDQLDGDVTHVEENCGFIWIETDKGKSYSILVTECEPDEDLD